MSRNTAPASAAAVSGLLEKDGLNDTTFGDQLSEYIRAGYQAMYVPTSEEKRVEKEVVRTAKKLQMSVYTWDHFEGFQLAGEGQAVPTEFANEKYRDAAAALRSLADAKWPGKCIFVMRDMPDFFINPVVRRAFRSLVESVRLNNERRRCPVVITSPSLEIHKNLRSCMTVLEFSLPDEDKLRAVFDYVRESASIGTTDASKTACPDDLRDAIVANLLGLTAAEAENTLSKCLVRHKGFTPEMLKLIKDEKAQIIRKGEVLTYIHEEVVANRNEIGGYENFLEFVGRRALAYGRDARVARLDYPKGAVLLGVPGTGKSMVALATGRLLNLPVYIMDVGAVFGSLVGESEARMRDAIRQISAQQGCVLLIDEADKAWGNAHDGRGDSGVTQRVFGQLLSWLASKQDRTFVIMTMNRTKGIPPEFLRSGRFDAVFFVDVPSMEERRQILKIHLAKRGDKFEDLPLSTADWDTLLERTEGWVGSEIEELVKEARFISFEQHKTGGRSGTDPTKAATPQLTDFIQAASNIIPLTKLAAEDVEAIRTFCKERARPASLPGGAVTAPPPRRRTVTTGVTPLSQ